MPHMIKPIADSVLEGSAVSCFHLAWAAMKASVHAYIFTFSCLKLKPSGRIRQCHHNLRALCSFCCLCSRCSGDPGLVSQTMCFKHLVRAPVQKWHTKPAGTMACLHHYPHRPGYSIQAVRHKDGGVEIQSARSSANLVATDSEAVVNGHARIHIIAGVLRASKVARDHSAA
eukprot:scaffold190979_cov18-Tisochrysis_lutea.AAC.2